MASGQAINLRSRRGAALVAIVAAALFGGWYFLLAHSPQSAVAEPINRGSTLTAPPAKKRPATRPGAAQPMPATRPVAGALQKPRPTIVREFVADALAPIYHDASNGFSIRFPQNWPIRTFKDQTWVLDCGDANMGLISVGFSPCPAEITIDQILPQAIARRIKRRPNTELLGQGKTFVAAKKALWSKSIGPLPMTDGSPRMTRVQYIVPLQDGRLMELRVAAPPASFNSLAPLFQQVLQSVQVDRR
jgi:hypothetical protein